MAVELCLLLLLCGSTISEVQPIYKPPPGTLDFGFVPAKTYDTGAYHEPGPIGILFKIVHSFLYLVQPNSFPQDLIRKLAQQKFGNTQGDYQKPENVVLTLQAIYYEIGFIVTAALGLLFILLLPLVGLCFCMCRCCDNCGGEMHQRQKKNADCQRSCFATFLFVASLIISVGVLCAYAANQHLTNQVRGAKKLVNSNFKDLKIFLNDTPAQIDYLVNQYNTTKDKALSELNNVGPLLGSRVQEQLGKEVHPALDAALTMAGVKVERAIKAIRETKEALENVSVSVEVLQEGTERLHANLTDVKMHLNNTLSDSACSAAQTASTCNIIRNSLNQLNINANFSGLPGVSSQLAKVNDVLKIDLSSLVQKGYAAFNDTPDLVVNQTRNILSGVLDIKTVLESIGSNITTFTKTLPVQNILADLMVSLTQSEAYVQDYFPVVEQYDFYRWLGCLILCCMVVLILVFYYLGLLCGTCGYDKHASPTTRGCISNTGGNFLMAGVGFSFLFSWVLMIVVVLTFVTGGNIEKLVCEPFEDKTLFKVLDTPYLLNQDWKNYLSGILFKNPNINLTFEKVYSDCKENKGIYTSLHLEHMFNIEEFLNISMYTEDVALKIEHIQINLSKIILLDEIGKENLLNFSSSGIEGINFAAYLTEINKSVTKVDLLSFANDLEARADQLPKGALENALKGHANSIRMIHNQQVVPLEQAMKYVKARSTLNQSIRLLKRTSSELMVKVKNVISAVNAAQLLINNNASLVIVQETKKYMDTIVGYFEQYVEWVKESIAMEVAACKPIANVIDTAVDIFLCSYITDSVNTFWFGLGSSSIFLIPAIIFAVKLSKYYRRMDTEDVYDDSVEQW
ncbi:prominin-1 isoform X2 [Athene cunicularia]|uniref:prominin-1 isoform X2 n=1 Tax=Athene cunicularia TaxID=194338 RepID=UPI000EF6F449|nr:prominin-1 isoform X2 [Athene cunicularia]